MAKSNGYFSHEKNTMFRWIQFYLKEWSQSAYRKPLLLRGARQVGKTFAVRQLGAAFPHFIEVNFEASPKLKKIFTDDKELNPERIIRDLSLTLNAEIIPGKTLLFFDEIQEAPAALIALRYFYEKMPELHVIAAGSLLDFVIESIGTPVGRVDFLNMYPMTWFEFLIAKGHHLIVKAILSQDANQPMTEIIHQKCLELLAEYLVIGGMPAAVDCWIQSQNPHECLKIQQSLLQTYRQDFYKYAKEHQIKYVEWVFEGCSAQLGKIFKFSHLGSEFRQRELMPALSLLEKANIVHRVYYSSGQGIPLGAQINPKKYKIIFLDVGLSQTMLGVNIADWFLEAEKTLINQGAITEAFVGQELLAYGNPYQKDYLYFWQREAKGSEAEVDYIIPFQQQVIPVEVKSGKGTQLKSLHLFLESHPKSSFGIRFSSHHFSIHEKLKSYPLYAIPSALQWNPPPDWEKLSKKS